MTAIEPERLPRSTPQDGSALVLVILLSLIVTVIGGTMLLMSNSDHMISANERDAERAMHAARAGVHYGFHLFQEGLVSATSAGVTFDSFASAVSAPLGGAEFTGRLTDISSTLDQGRLYRLESTGRYRRASRATEMVFQVVPEALKYGIVAFDDALFHHHSGGASAEFKIESTLRAHGDVEVDDGLTLASAVVSSGRVDVDATATLDRDVFAHEVANLGTIQGKAMMLAAVRKLPIDAGTWDRTDAYGSRYSWFNGISSPGSLTGNAPAGGQSTYAILDGDVFRSEVFTRGGSLMVDPELNVTRYVPPPLLDYVGMRVEADRNEPTYFATSTDAVNYLISKKINETHGGVDAVSIRVGTTDDPEFIYVADDLHLVLNPRLPDSAGIARIAADGLFIEGGIYVAGDFSFKGPTLRDAYLSTPPPPNYPMLVINATAYCLPALVAYGEPASGSPASWTPADTPPIGAGSDISMLTVPFTTQGLSRINGVVYAQDQNHMAHKANQRELIRLQGAQLGWTLHNDDYLWLTYDPDVRCTKFLVTDREDPAVVSFREVR